MKPQALHHKWSKNQMFKSDFEALTWLFQRRPVNSYQDFEPCPCVQETEIKGSKSGDEVISRSTSRFEDSDYDSDCVRTCSEPSIGAIVHKYVPRDTPESHFKIF